MKLFFCLVLKIKYLLQAIDKWLRKKEFKQARQISEFSQRRQARIRDRIKETIEEAKKTQQSAKEAEHDTELTESTITITQVMTITEVIPTTTIVVEDEEEVMIIDQHNIR